MKARLIAILLSIIVIPFSSQAENEPQKTQAKQVLVKGKINLNTADAHSLTGSFKGIGKKRAEAIIAYRENHQGFKSLEELAEVKGIGQRFVDKNREKLKEIFVIN
ncbi:ComEA family DNA-binding protein [Legionella pneumophila]|uniref:ComEA family DNA-binding protein n=1 Tax=Legionella pneumophila TaxID=446 RepID=UPI000482F68B|nr:helix-hairpin-helix domain-containing protein [Legionella pneumophila]MCK1860924.1 helix-hairpin-helix domain-containing protein [Legionella pneumophila]MCW8437123.1 helix-hairpin-helix domain-containing protein [Legionella pneumophila]MCW8476427.1 helix-hairpin-helix domain-containing protein [Legionella pneumophila]MCW8479476.1 helix-hairpin-helix domain-containing protein [Legionella pneumophila]MCW8491022.1 helix-hairpin-helix domain-containing protein [Legionella pneumophila]